jgi:tetratricopeptide (TPR) repeat protein
VHLNRFLPCRLILAAAFLGVATLSSYATEESGVTPAAMQAGEGYLRALETAGAAYAAGQFSNALGKLDICDEIHANVPDTWIMRGAVLASQHQYDKARAAFDKAAQLAPTDFWAHYNIAELYLVQKKYPEAVAAYKALSVYKGQEELVSFKIVYANLLQGKLDAAKAELDAMKFPSDTPAYYFAHSAWGFASGNKEDGDYWVGAGMKIFGPPKCLAFYDALVQAGWLPPRNADGSYPSSDSTTSLPAVSPPPADVFPGAGSLR